MRDRGAIKWSSLMLPEHKKLLKKLAEEQSYIEKPALDENKCEEINRILVNAIENSLYIRLKLYQSNVFNMVEGIVKKCDSMGKKLKVCDGSGKELIIYLEQIVDGEIVSGRDL